MTKKLMVFCAVILTPGFVSASQMGGLVDALWPVFLAPVPLLMALGLLVTVLLVDKSDQASGAYRLAMYFSNATIALSGIAAAPTLLITVSGIFTGSRTYYYLLPLSIMCYALVCGIYSQRALKVSSQENMRKVKALLWVQLLPLAYLAKAVFTG